MPNVISGNTIAASLMIGETAAETIAAEDGVKLREFVGEQPASQHQRVPRRREITFSDCATKTEASASGREPTPGVFGSVWRGLAFVC